MFKECIKGITNIYNGPYIVSKLYSGNADLNEALADVINNRLDEGLIDLILEHANDSEISSLATNALREVVRGIINDQDTEYASRIIPVLLINGANPVATISENSALTIIAYLNIITTIPCTDIPSNLTIDTLTHVLRNHSQELDQVILAHESIGNDDLVDANDFSATQRLVELINSRNSIDRPEDDEKKDSDIATDMENSSSSQILILEQLINSNRPSNPDEDGSYASRNGSVASGETVYYSPDRQTSALPSAQPSTMPSLTYEHNDPYYVNDQNIELATAGKIP